jgi:penicillin-binding protein 1A
LSKDEILTLYLNQIYFGHRRHGIEEAARFYFGKSATLLTLGEAAVLAGLIKSPGRFSPRLHPRAAKGRQREVLRNVLRASQAGKLSRVYSEAEVKAAMDAPLVVWHPNEPWLGKAPYYADLVRQRVQAMLGEKKFFRGNLRVDTACDIKLQVAAERALRDGLARIDRRRGWRGAEKRLSASELAAFRKALSKERREVVAGELYRAAVTHVDRDGARVSLGRLDAVLPAKHASWALGGALRRRRSRTPRRALSDILGVGDVIHVRVVSLGDSRAPRAPRRAGAKAAKPVVSAGEVIVALEQTPEVQGALVVIDPATRDVLALVGGYDFAKSPFNRAVNAQRQPGSAFKPIVYSAAVRTKRYTPSTIMIDSPAVYGPIFSRHAYRPQNYDRRFRGPVRLRSALGQSLNLVAVKVADEIGIESVREEAKLLGIESPISKNLAVALGADSVTPLELANAYAVFASGGKLETPKVVRRVLLRDGSSIEPKVEPPKQAMTPEHAFIMTSLLRAPIEDPNGTARRAGRVGHLVAGKTGTTNKHIDAWFVGYTPRLLAAVWVGHDDRKPLGGRATGGHVAVPIWLDFMNVAMAGQPRSDFARPLGIESARVDPHTGLRAAAGQVDAIEEVFVGGTAPRDEAPRPGHAASPETLLLLDDAVGAPPPSRGPTSPPTAPPAAPLGPARTPTSVGH